MPKPGATAVDDVYFDAVYGAFRDHSTRRFGLVSLFRGLPDADLHCGLCSSTFVGCSEPF